MSWKTIFQDAEGDWNAAEICAVPAAVAGVGTYLWQCWHGTAFDFQNFGTGLGLLVTAIGAAQRLRGDADRRKPCSDSPSQS